MDPRGSSPPHAHRRKAIIVYRTSIRQSAPRARGFSWTIVVAAAIAGVAAGGSARSADLEEATTLYRTGRYDDAAEKAAEAIRQGAATENWYALKIRSEMTRGKYSEAGATLEEGIRRFPASLNLYL